MAAKQLAAAVEDLPHYAAVATVALALALGAYELGPGGLCAPRCLGAVPALPNRETHRPQRPWVEPFAVIESSLQVESLHKSLLAGHDLGAQTCRVVNSLPDATSSCHQHCVRTRRRIWIRSMS